MSKSNLLKLQGKILEILPNTIFKVQLENKTIITAYISGKIRMHYIRILPGDVVTIEMSSYDLEKGRIIFRHK